MSGKVTNTRINLNDLIVTCMNRGVDRIKWNSNRLSRPLGNYSGHPVVRREVRFPGRQEGPATIVVPQPFVQYSVDVRNRAGKNLLKGRCPDQEMDPADYRLRFRRQGNARTTKEIE